MLILEIALGIVLGYVLLWLFQIKEFWEVLGYILLLCFIIALLMFFKENEGLLSVFGTIAILGLDVLLIWYLWKNRKKAHEIPKAIKNWFCSQMQEVKHAGLGKKIVLFMGVLVFPFYFFVFGAMFLMLFCSPFFLVVKYIF